MDANLFNLAVTFLSKELSPNFIDKLLSSHVDSSDHFGIGMMVRNVLRRSDVQYDDVWLDDNWYEILQEVLKRQ